MKKKKGGGRRGSSSSKGLHSRLAAEHVNFPLKETNIVMAANLLRSLEVSSCPRNVEVMVLKRRE